MARRFKNALPWIALAGGLLAITCLVLLSSLRNSLLVDSGETRPAVEALLEKLQAMRPTSLDDDAFRNAVEQTAQAPHVATLWLLAPDGQVVYSIGSTAASFSQGTVEDHASNEINRVLAALPDDALNIEQQNLLLAASAIQSEGEHNDIYRHMIRKIIAPDGTMVALVGAAYNVSDDVVGTEWPALVLGGLFGICVYWLALPLWVFIDARTHGERAWGWAIFVLLGNLVALIAYILARIPQPKVTTREYDCPI